MGASENRSKNQAMAAHLARTSPFRKTGSCPMGCGRPITIGGQALTAHLNVCKGSPRRIAKATRKNG